MMDINPDPPITVPTIIDAMCAGALNVLESNDNLSEDFKAGFHMAVQIISETVHEFDVVATDHAAQKEH